MPDRPGGPRLDRRALAWLEEQFGKDRVRNHPMILPRVEFFPGEFDGTAEDARRVLDLVCGFMGIDPSAIEMQIFDGNFIRAAGIYEAFDDKFRIWIADSQLSNALALVSTIAHELGHVLLLGQGRITTDADDHEPLTDLITVYFGLGFFSANAAILESHWQQGSASGWSVGKHGYLTMPYYGYALAKYARVRGEDGSAWKRELRLDVRSAFKKSMRYLEARDREGAAPGPAPAADNSVQVAGEVWTLSRTADDDAIKAVVVEWSERLARGRYADALALCHNSGLIPLHTPLVLERTIAGYGVPDHFDAEETFAVTPLRGRSDADEIIRDNIRVDRKNLYGLDATRYLGTVYYDGVLLNGERSELGVRFHLVKLDRDRLALELFDFEVM